MFEDIKGHVKDWNDDEEITAYLQKLLHKEAFDRAGLIYGMGHAVYSLSDPRAKIMARFVEGLSKEKGRGEEYQLYANVERLATQLIAKERKIYKAFPPMWISTAASFTACWTCPWSCTPPFSPLPASPAGAPTALRSLSAAARSSGPPTWRYSPTGSSRRAEKLPQRSTVKKRLPESSGKALFA